METPLSKIEKYSAPPWIPSNCPIVPKDTLKFVHSATPIHHWNLPGIPDGVELSIKRDDLNGIEISGNKVRKLEILLADAVKTGCTHVATTGSLQSNHCRVTALMCAKLGLTAHIYLRDSTKVPGSTPLDLRGNLLLGHLSGARLHLVPAGSEPDKIFDLMERDARKMLERNRENMYVIPLGGSNPLGAYGYIEAFKELIEQGARDRFTDLVVCAGSGGTLTGLAIANALTGFSFKVHGISISRKAEFFYDHIQETLDAFELNDFKATEIVNVIDGYTGLGYGMATSQELDFIEFVAKTTGVILDPTYTGKTVRGLLCELQQSPEQFKGHHILYVHTGGIFGLLDKRMQSHLESKQMDVELHPVL